MSVCGKLVVNKKWRGTCDLLNKHTGQCQFSYVVMGPFAAARMHKEFPGVEVDTPTGTLFPSKAWDGILQISPEGVVGTPVTTTTASKKPSKRVKS